MLRSHIDMTSILDLSIAYLVQLACMGMSLLFWPKTSAEQSVQ